jgi:DGQHR domain-containing protein
MSANEIIKIPSLLVDQFTEKKIFVSKISFVDLQKIALFTYRKTSLFDPYSDENQLSSYVQGSQKESYYQRLVNDDRTKGVYDFLLEEINNKVTGDLTPLGSFPTSMILALDADEEAESIEEHEENVRNSVQNDQPSPGVFIDEQSSLANIYIPKAKSALIVDGQHRIVGMIRLLKDARENSIKVGRKSLDKAYPELTAKDVIRELNKFEFVCTLLVGFDMWEQGRIFADVNFNQKPVNKSLYYDIFGSYPAPNKNEIFLAHMLAMHLNNSEKSVLKGRFKMLGRGEGLFSQAFFVEAVLPLFRDKNIWSDIPFDYMDGGEKHHILPKFFSAYFRAIQNVFVDYWPSKDQNTARRYRHILLKTTGMGALLKLIPFVYVELSTEITFETATSKEIRKGVEKIFLPIKHNGEDYFSETSDYAGSGSQGMLGKLYKRIYSDLGCDH